MVAVSGMVQQGNWPIWRLFGAAKSLLAMATLKS